jgi:hypothetical protein
LRPVPIQLKYRNDPKVDFGQTQEKFYNGGSRHPVDIGIHAEKEVIQ